MQFWQNWQKLRGWLSGKTSRRGEKLRRPRRLSFDRLEDRTLLAVVPELVRDISLGLSMNNGSAPSNIVAVGGLAFFTATDSIHGTELWKSDGTCAGTVLVKDILPGPTSSDVRYFCVANGVIFFSSNDGVNGTELWKSDGTSAGTVMVRDISPGNAGSFSSGMIECNGLAYFSASDGIHGRELWRTDGTSLGTYLVADISLGVNESSITNLTNVNGTLLFSAGNGSGSELWKSDGTSTGTLIVADIGGSGSGSYPRFITNVGGIAYFQATESTTGSELWRSGGTSSGTWMVKDINSGTVSSTPKSFTNVNGTIYFVATTATYGTELWRTDGSEFSTRLETDLIFGTGSGLDSATANLVNVNGTLFFAGTSTAQGTELWKASPSFGYQQLLDIFPGSQSSRPNSLTNVNGILFFSGFEQTNGSSIWKSNGTSTGTILVRDPSPGSPLVNLNGIQNNLVNVNGTLFFQANDDITNYELWTSNGTCAGTRMVRDIRYDVNSSLPKYLTEVGASIFFQASGPTGQPELWVTDGTSSGTQVVIDVDSLLGGARPKFLTNVAGTLFFQATTSTTNQELWKSNGTSSGTVIVKDIRAAGGSGYPYSLKNLNGRLVFVANDGVVGKELWISDGTSSGTNLVRDIFPGTGGLPPRFFETIGDTLYFQVNDNSTGYELWKSNGTSSGTALVRDIAPGSSWGFPLGLTKVNGTLFFQATTSGIGAELWKSDGTSSGTVMVSNISASGSSNPSFLTNVNGRLFFAATDGIHGTELWTSDGTSSGTRLVADSIPGSLGVNPTDLINANGVLFFSANDGANGTELWRSDGTSSGTYIVKDIASGSESSLPASFTVLDYLLYFTATAEQGFELWRSDGTCQGTMLVADLNPGPEGSAATGLIAHDNRLFFAADDSVHGIELWSVKNPPRVSISISSSELNETGGMVTITATLSEIATESVTTELAFTGTATLGDDYVTSTMVVIPAGAPIGTTVLAINDDLTFENSESIIVDVKNITNGYENGVQQYSVTILDNDPLPTVVLTPPTSTLNESSGSTSIVALLSNPTTQPVTIDLSFSGTAARSSDFSASAASILIPAGQTSGSILLIGLDDTTFEGAESIVIDVTAVVNGAENGTQSVIATITDNDNAPSVTLAITGSPLAENGGVGTVIVTLSNPSTQNVTVNFGFNGSATFSGDYTANMNSLVITAGQTAGVITLVGIDDTVIEEYESIVVDVLSVTNGIENGTQSITASITDDDTQPSVTLSHSGTVLAEKAGAAVVVATLSNPWTQSVTVNLGLSGTAVNNSDYSVSSLSIAIPAGSLTGAVTLTGIDDNTFEGSESIIVDVTDVINGTENGTQSVTASIADDESIPNVTISVSASSLVENGGVTTVRATFSNPTAQDVTVSLGFSGTATAATEYSASASSIVISAGQTSGSITIRAVDDLLREGDETIVIDVSGVVNGTENGAQQVTASITDDVSDPFQLAGNTLTIFGTSGDDTLAINYGSSTSSFTATVNAGNATFSASIITIDSAGGNDTLNITLSSLADTATFGGLSGSVTSSNYSISFSNVETAVMFGSTADRVTFNDPGAVNTFTFLSAYSIMKSTAAGYTNQTVGFGGSNGNGVGNNDSIFLYGDSGNQTLTASPTQVSMTVGTQSFVGNNMRNSYAYGTLSGSAGTDSATYNGTSADEVLTSTPGYSIVSSTQTLQYFVGFRNVTANSGGGVDSAKMYDSAGNDTFSSSTTAARFFGTTFDYQANGYTRIYAYQTRGSDTATLNGTAGNDRVSSLPTYVILSTSPFIQQVFNFSTVIVNAGTGTDTATLDDSTGNDTLNASGGLAELIYASGRRIQINGFDTVTARGINGSVNRRNVTGTLAYVLRFTGTWV